MFTKNWTRLLTVAATLCVLAAIPAYAQDTLKGGTPSNFQDNEEAVRADATVFAQAFDIPIEEAIRRLKLQPQISELDATLQANEHATFAGLWIEQTPKFRVVVQLTRGDKTTILRYIQTTPLADLVDVQNAPLSLVAQQALHTNMLRTIATANIPAETGLILQTGRIQVYVTDSYRAQLDAVLARAGGGLQDKIDVATVRTLLADTANQYAGFALAQCTSGFTVQKIGTTNRYSSTAGHCDPGTQISPLQAPIFRRDDGPVDFQVNAPPTGSTLKNWTADNVNDSTPYYRVINNYITTASVGSGVCKYGKATIQTCGTVTENNATNDGRGPFLRIAPFDNNNPIACGGDSGGPVFSGNSAVGIVKAAACSTDPTNARNTMIAMTIKAMYDSGYAPLTTP